MAVTAKSGRREPGRAEGLSEEEGVEEVGQLSLLAVRHREGGQRLDAEQNDGQQRHQHRPDGHHVRNPRRLRKLEHHPDAAQPGVGRPRHLLGGVTLRAPVLVDGVRLQLVEDKLVEEDVVRDGIGAPETAAALVVDEDRLEARPVSVEEELAALAVVELGASETVPEQRARVTVEDSQSRLEVVTADVDAHPLISASETFTTPSWTNEKQRTIINYRGVPKGYKGIYTSPAPHHPTAKIAMHCTSKAEDSKCDKFPTG